MPLLCGKDFLLFPNQPACIEKGLDVRGGGWEGNANFQVAASWHAWKTGYDVQMVHKPIWFPFCSCWSKKKSDIAERSKSSKCTLRDDVQMRWLTLAHHRHVWAGYREVWAVETDESFQRKIWSCPKVAKKIEGYPITRWETKFYQKQNRVSTKQKRSQYIEASHRIPLFMKTVLFCSMILIESWGFNATQQPQTLELLDRDRHVQREEHVKKINVNLSLLYQTCRSHL